MSETVTIRRAASVADPYSGQSTGLDWSAATDTEVTCLGFSPGGSADLSVSWRVGADTGPTVYLPAGTDVLSTDRVVVRGTVYEVDGVPQDWRSPYSGSRPGLSVTLRRLGA